MPWSSRNFARRHVLVQVGERARRISWRIRIPDENLPGFARLDGRGARPYVDHGARSVAFDRIPFRLAGLIVVIEPARPHENTTLTNFYLRSIWRGHFFSVSRAPQPRSPAISISWA